MSFHLKPAIREGVFLNIGLGGASGSGKTYTALEIAMGIVNNDVSKIGFIDTEGRRALHYADIFGKFQHIDFMEPFSSLRYVDAIMAVEAAGCKVCIIDSASHGHNGTGGMLEYHDAELDRIAGNDYTKRQACNMLAWVKPKTEHKKFVNKFLQSRMHIIFCFRAEEKVKMEKQTVKGKEKTVIVPIGWQPICEKNLPYEMTCSFTLTPDKPGIPIPIKLQEQHKHIFPLDKPINRECGRKLAEWAKGTVTKPEPSLSDDLSKKIGLVQTENDLEICRGLLNEAMPKLLKGEISCLKKEFAEKEKSLPHMVEDLDKKLAEGDDNLITPEQRQQIYDVGRQQDMMMVHVDGKIVKHFEITDVSKLRADQFDEALGLFK